MDTRKKFSVVLAMALGLAAVGCVDDSKDEGDGKLDAGRPSGDADAGADGGLSGVVCVDNEGVSGGKGTACTGGYAGVTDTQIAENICDPKAACANLADIDGICSQDPATKAKDIGIPCYFGHANDADVGAAVGECALNGEGDLEGLKTTLAGMSEQCISCYVDVVVCSAQKCTMECGFGSDDECTACREKFGCTDNFFVCAGIKSVPDIQEASK